MNTKYSVICLLGLLVGCGDSNTPGLQTSGSGTIQTPPLTVTPPVVSPPVTPPVTVVPTPPVVPTSTSVTLSWDAPTENSDGTALTDLAGYYLYYGTASHNYTEKVKLGVGLSLYAIDLSAGTYYFAMSAYNSTGTESITTGEVSNTVP